jgi:hypothetical protein
MTTSEWPAVSGPCALADQHPAVDAPTRRITQDLGGPRGEIVRRLFGARVIDDGAGMIRLSVPHVAQRDVPVPLSVEVNWSLVLTKAVARLYRRRRQRQSAVTGFLI